MNQTQRQFSLNRAASKKQIPISYMSAVKTILSLVVLALAGAISMPAQTPPEIQWQQTFGGNSNDVAYVVKQTGDGGYIFGGGSRSGVTGNKTNVAFGDYDYWVVKADANGNRQWDKSFGGSGDDRLQSLQQTSDGGYIFGGYSNSGVSGNKTNASSGGYDYWIVKADANGNRQWSKSFGGSGSDYLYSLQQTRDGGYFLGGWSDSSVSLTKTNAGFGGYDYWVVKLDTNGSKQWDKSYGGSITEILLCAQQTGDGGFILGGYSSSGVSGNKTTASFGFDDYWVVKLDAAGNKQWEQSFGGSSFDQLFSLQQTTDDGYILGGGSSSAGSSGNKTSPGFGAADYWVVKLDLNGNKQWEQSFGGDVYDELRSLQQTSDGGYILGGVSASGVSGNKTSAAFGNWDQWVVRLDSNGNKQWEQSFGGSDFDEIRRLQQTADGGYVLIGQSNSGASGNKTVSSFGGYDFWVVKLWTPLRFSSFSRGLDNIFQAQVSGIAGTNYIFQASTDLTNWTSLLTNNAADGMVNFTDTNVASFSARFFRVQQQP